MDSIIGKRLEGRYEINELIGVGGMANVYKAVDVTDGKIVAVKVLREEFYSNEEFIRRFKNESKAIALLSHPNIIQVYDVCLSGRIKSIVMEHIDGITLKEYKDQQGALPWKEALHFTVQILRALSHAHSKGIVHRDIKPQNVLLLPDGQIKLTDFGIARFARGESKSLTDRAIGSVHYISPEQARGGHTDQRADIYSVGIMIYEMLSGQLPFDDDSPVSVALKQIQLDAPLLESINPDIPKGLANITARAMQKDPDRRYQTAEEFLSDIEAFQKDPSIQFEYKYLANEALEQARYRDAIYRVREEDLRMTKKNRTPRSEYPREYDDAPERDNNTTERRGWPIIKMLIGITVTFVAITAAFIAGMLYYNNPLEKVPEATVPDFIGKKLDDILDATEYRDFIIEVGESAFSENHASGVIVDQVPKTGKKVKIGSTIRVTPSSGQNIIIVPAVIGLEETEAYRMLADLNLTYLKVDTFSTYPAGTVIMTDPAPNARISGDTVVKVQISKGPENRQVSVPDVVNKSLDEAKAIIKLAGLNVGGISYISSEIPYGTVVAQDPPPAAVVMLGELVNLNVSGGPDMKKRITLTIPLPVNVTESVKLQVMHNNNIIQEAHLIPSEARNWSPAFEGSGKSTLNILYNDFLYMKIELNFEDGQWAVTEDNTAAHV